LELCTSIKAEAAVAEGAAIYSAIRSGLVQKHVLRNALMLDVLPHSIGVLVDSSTGCNRNDDDIDELYLPILHKGMVLPAMGYAKFRLADVRQKGITIVAVEDVSDDLPLERIGEFTFLLHRLTEKQYNDMEVRRDNSDEGRTVNVGMTVEVDGKFIVSIFDENDPEHLRKKIKYQEFKKQRQQIDDQGDKLFNLRGPKESGGGGGNHDDSKIQQINSHEAVLISGCILLFILYLLLRVYFHVPSVTGDDSNNEF
jgi:molecular chaperone DnaK (HSP70)